MEARNAAAVRGTQARSGARLRRGDGGRPGPLARAPSGPAGRGAALRGEHRSSDIRAAYRGSAGENPFRSARHQVIVSREDVGPDDVQEFLEAHMLVCRTHAIGKWPIDI